MKAQPKAPLKRNPFWSPETYAYRTTQAGVNVKSFLDSVEKLLIVQMEQAFNTGFEFSEVDTGVLINRMKKELAQLRAEAEQMRQALHHQQQFIDELMEAGRTVEV